MLKVTRKAAAMLKAAKSAETAKADSGIRIEPGVIPEQPDKLGIGFAVSDGPEDGDAELEQNGLRIFVSTELIETLEHRTLDVSSEEEGEPELIFR